MNLVTRTFYQAFVGSIRAYQRLFLDFRVWGRENIRPGPKIFVVNHVSSTDVYWILPIFTEPVHLILGPCYKSPLLARMLDKFEHISAMPGDTKTLVRSAVAYLNKGESVVIAPEGDLQEPFHLGPFLPGVAALYRRARVPIVPMALAAPKRSLRHHRHTIVVDGRVFRTVSVLRGTFCINIGEPMTPDCSDGTRSEQNDTVLVAIRCRMQMLLDDIRINKFWS